MTIYSGSADPDRVLPLLWRHTAGAAATAPTAGRKPGLTIDAVVAAGIGVADALGLDALSMSRVAGQLGVGTMTLYTYVPSKGELLDLMVDSVLFSADWPSAEGSWRIQVTRYADVVRGMYRRHVWLGQVSTVRPPIGPGMLGESEYVLSALADVNLPPRQRTAAAHAITMLAHAIGREEAEAAYLERVTGQSNDAWWGDRMELWEKYFEPARHPAMTAAWEGGGYDETTTSQTSHAAEFALKCLLDGIGAS
ncbi:TetR/AcrR family transcriptional regulator C-terminal domain-containing protein [Hoyosella subflava]|uniref:Transcriptional regulator, TetR family n=1 Tax=Hoyosella subflava (strain DSM 45089 / JCM 17490 / NBRC 109087 / DQS3-9A1) TaxID=443218 RepID=F6EGL8_HOYSD|nr:TetR/AcrR family transcriptional regulator C-terminal domain-containing protein [Hoyosella subflava]AEF41071.1 Transcriptional regulator, TetR family [Hoyosella subflava DQS3-9A1]